MKILLISILVIVSFSAFAKNEEGFVCRLQNNTFTENVYISKIDFKKSTNKMKFYLLDEKDNVVEKKIRINGLEITGADFDYSGYPSSGIIDSKWIQISNNLSIVVRQFLGSTTQFISVQNSPQQDELFAVAENCKAATFNNVENKVVRL